MFILSQDKKNLADYKKVYVSQKYRRKKGKKSFLLGVPADLLGEIDVKSLGTYESEEAAIAELENICSAMKNGEAAYAVK